MKLLSTTIFYLLLHVAAVAQSTNLAIRVTVTVDGVSTNQTTLNLNHATAKDRVLIEGAIWDFKGAQANGQTNTLDFYIARVKIKDDLKATADAKNRAESAATLEKLTRLLTTELDLLTTGDLSSLSTIAAKAP